MTERRRGRETRTTTRERTTAPSALNEEVREADIVPGSEGSAGQTTEQIAIRAVEFGKMPTTKRVERGKRIADLVAEGFLSGNQEFYVNGELVDQNYTLQANDAVVGAPRVAGG